MTAVIAIGSISHGTLQTRDLLSAFAIELERVDGDAALVNEARSAITRMGADGSGEEESDSELVNELQDALDAAAPDGMYFGNTEGDGSDFGFWHNEAGRRPALAEEFAAAFEHKTRDNGDSFYCLRDGSPEWMSDAIHDAHGSMFPDDHVYSFARDAAAAIAEMLQDDIDADLDDAGERVDGMVSVYHADRFRWLASNLQRAAMCDEAREEGLVAEDASLSDRIAAGMYHEADQVFRAIAAAITEAAAD